jgi:hypothetical protein
MNTMNRNTFLYYVGLVQSGMGLLGMMSYNQYLAKVVMCSGLLIAGAIFVVGSTIASTLEK